MPVDMASLTVRQTQSPNYFPVWESRTKVELGSISVSHKIDLHHWYDQGELWQHLVQSALDTCHAARLPPRPYGALGKHGASFEHAAV